MSIRVWTVRAGRAPGTVVRCGLMDTVLAKSYISVVFGYESALDADRLAASLSAALDAVPVYAGRLRAGDPLLTIVCDDSGVPMSSLDVELTLDEAMRDALRPDSVLVDHVDAGSVPLERRPLLTVRVCRLADGGATLGCSWQHGVGDMASLMTLARVWSAIDSGGAVPEVVLVEDRDGYLDAALPAVDCGRSALWVPDHEQRAAIGRELGLAVRQNRMVRLRFEPDEVAAMVRRLGAEAGRTLSTNDALCAHLATTVREWDGDRETRDLSIVVDLRRRLGLPAGLIGNVVGDIYLSCPPDEGRAALAGRIRAGVDDFLTTQLCARSSRAFVAGVGWDRLAECASVAVNPPRRTMMITNWTRMGVYDVEFGGRRPRFFTPANNVPTPWIGMVSEGPGGAGLLFTVGLPNHLADRLDVDAGRAAVHRFAA